MYSNLLAKFGKKLRTGYSCRSWHLVTSSFILQDVVELALRWDVDDDGLIDNAGFADQTFDAWTMTGAR